MTKLVRLMPGESCTSIDSFGPHNGANVNRTQSQQKKSVCSERLENTLQSVRQITFYVLSFLQSFLESSSNHYWIYSLRLLYLSALQGIQIVWHCINCFF